MPQLISDASITSVPKLVRETIPLHIQRHMNTQLNQRERRGKHGSHSPKGHRCFEKLPQTILILCLVERKNTLTLLHKSLTQNSWAQMYFQIQKLSRKALLGIFNILHMPSNSLGQLGYFSSKKYMNIYTNVIKTLNCLTSEAIFLKYIQDGAGFTVK